MEGYQKEPLHKILKKKIHEGSCGTVNSKAVPEGSFRIIPWKIFEWFREAIPKIISADVLEEIHKSIPAWIPERLLGDFVKIPRKKFFFQLLSKKILEKFLMEYLDEFLEKNNPGVISEYIYERIFDRAVMVTSEVVIRGFQISGSL